MGIEGRRRVHAVLHRRFLEGRALVEGPEINGRGDPVLGAGRLVEQHGDLVIGSPGSEHPQYHEEWAKTSAELNGQYNEALDQRKELIGQRFGI